MEVTWLNIIHPEKNPSRERWQPKLEFSLRDRKWQDYVYIQCEHKSTKQKIKHLLSEENKVKENKIS